MSLHQFWSLWSWDPSVIFGCVALGVAFHLISRGKQGSRPMLFYTGLAVIFLALESPLDTLGDTYLFSAHMIQHLLLILVGPPLLLAGIPEWAAQRLLNWPIASRVEEYLGNPWWAWFIGIGTLWIWHLPVLYNATLANENIHIFEHVTFLVTATIFWWPFQSPVLNKRMAPLASVLYLFAAAAANSILGILITYARPGLYPAYLHPLDEFGLLDTIRQGWGISAAADQQIGGLIMWVAGGLAYVIAAMVGLGRWFATPERTPSP